MSDLELLFLVLVVLYGWECACWLPRGSVAWLTWLGARWRLVRPGMLLGNHRGGFVFAPPLPPLGWLISGIESPVSLSPEAIRAGGSTVSLSPVGGDPNQPDRCLSLDDIQKVEADGKRLRINGKLFLKAPSPTLASNLQERLSKLIQAPQTDRGRLVERWCRERFDAQAIASRWAEFQRRARPIRWTANGLFAWLFVVAPLAVCIVGLKLAWLGWLAGLLAFTSVSAFLFRRAHRALYPGAEDERFTHFLIIVLSPVSAIRTADLLSRHLLETFHPLAISRVLCSRESFVQFAEGLWREISFPESGARTANEMASAVEQYSRAALRRAMESFLKSSGVEPADLVRPPAPADSTCRAYCPRCLAQFTTADTTCADCGGRRLIAFQDPFAPTPKDD